MVQLAGNKVIHGKNGSVWWDGEELAEIESFEAVIAIKREDITFVNQVYDESKFVGLSGTGKMKMKKINNRVGTKLVEALSNGIDVRSSIVAKLDDKDSLNGAIRVSISNVWFTGDIPVIAFESGGIVTEEISFGFAGAPKYQ
jgi:hypothetical protein